jgi:hypothetical protein
MVLGGARLVSEVDIGATIGNVELLAGGSDVEPSETVGLQLRDSTGTES